MPLHSALEDLRDTTLRKVTGLLGRLDYLARLRGADGKYSHWGLSRVHGDAAAQEALSEAHQATTAEILRTPLRRMVQDAETSGEAQDVPPHQYAKELEDRGAGLLPANPAAGSRRHLNSVLRVLSYLVKPR
jgi:hypothetical protein